MFITWLCWLFRFWKGVREQEVRTATTTQHAKSVSHIISSDYCPSQLTSFKITDTHIEYSPSALKTTRRFISLMIRLNLNSDKEIFRTCREGRRNRRWRENSLYPSTFVGEPRSRSLPVGLLAFDWLTVLIDDSMKLLPLYAGTTTTWTVFVARRLRFPARALTMTVTLNTLVTFETMCDKSCTTLNVPWAGSTLKLPALPLRRKERDERLDPSEALTRTCNSFRSRDVLA